MNFLGPYKYVVDFLVIAVLVGAAALGVHKYNTYQQDIGAARVQAQWDREKAADAVAKAQMIQDQKAKGEDLQHAMDTQRSQTNAQITLLNSSLASAITGLRERPSRDSSGGVPRDPATGAAVGGTGATLLRQDSEFLVRESARADKLRLELVDCQAAYGRARAAVN
jgi:hypothetical protein